MSTWTWELDGWIVASGLLCAVAAALLGNFLVLRRLSMLGDAISHAVLPGLAVAFFITDSRNSLPMFLGALVVGMLTAFFTEWIRRAGRVDEGASMGVVFTSLFALGLVLIVQAADHVDLDPGCVLYGAIELTPFDMVRLGTWEVPRAVATLGVIALLNALFVTVFFKELRISAFDPALATALGINATWMHYALMVFVALTAVASFEAVGNILVVAMLIVPAATAYLITDRLSRMVCWSVLVAAVAAVSGHVAAITVPLWFGFRSTTTAGMMAVMSGLIFFSAVFAAPRHGIIARSLRRSRIGWSILADDVVALLFRIEERGYRTAATPENLQSIVLARRIPLRMALAWLVRRREITRIDGQYRLTQRGRDRARGLVRSHRLWEQYLMSQLGVDAERIHDQAERLEHFTDSQLRKLLDAETGRPERDPHGRPIPAEDTERSSEEPDQ